LEKFDPVSVGLWVKKFHVIEPKAHCGHKSMLLSWYS